jgi:predicted O-methyltransferase YrrM
LSWRDEPPGVDLRSREQVDLTVKIAPMLSEAPRDRYRPHNNMFGSADAAVLHAMIRHLKPRRIVEVGSGYSTAMLLDTAERAGLEIEVTCIEPYPDRLLHLLMPHDKVSLISEPVQGVSLTTFTRLEANDILFIDSTHVVKAGSDVLWLFLHVLPRLRAGVAVHVHDIFWPFEYPDAWLREGRDWNETYLLNAFLCHNKSWDLLFFSSWLWKKHPQLLPADLREAAPGSLWMQRNTH